MNRKKTISISSKPSLTQSGTGSVKTDFTLHGAIKLQAGPASTEALDHASKEPAHGLFAKTLYGAVYSLSFGAVFGTLIFCKLIPGGRIIRRAMNDGSHSAQRALMNLEGKTESGRPAEGTVMA